MHLCLYYCPDWKPAITARQLEIVWNFSLGHAGVLGNERVDVLAGSAEIRGILIIDPPAVSAIVQDILTVTKTSF